MGMRDGVLKYAMEFLDIAGPVMIAKNFHGFAGDGWGPQVAGSAKVCN